MKRPLAHRLFSAWLALLVLTASVGLTVQQHVCRMSGQHTAQVVFAAPHHGCPAPMATAAPAQAGKAQLKAACCDFKAFRHKLSAPTTDHTWSKAAVPVALALPAAPAAWLQVPKRTWLQPAAGWYASDTSPPGHPAGRALLTLVCTLVV